MAVGSVHFIKGFLEKTLEEHGPEVTRGALLMWFTQATLEEMLVVANVLDPPLKTWVMEEAKKRAKAKE